MRRRASAAVALALGAGAAAAQGFDIPADLVDQLRTGRCEHAARGINRGLAREDARTMVMAGWMFERGYCVKADVDRAYALYEKAHARGDPFAAVRLASLASTTAGGADVAAVLWWARHAKGLALAAEGGSCDPLPNDPSATEDRFVEALKAWPPGRLEACRGVVGMNAILSSDMRYPVAALRNEQQAVLAVDYDLVDGSFQVERVSGDAGYALRQFVDAVARDAMARVPRTSRSVRGRLEFVFRIE